MKYSFHGAVRTCIENQASKLSRSRYRRYHTRRIRLTWVWMGVLAKSRRNARWYKGSHLGMWTMHLSIESDNWRMGSGVELPSFASSSGAIPSS